MHKLSEYFADAKKNRWAIGHFNFSSVDVLHAIIAAAKETEAPCVMVGTSEGEAKFFGLAQAAAVVRSAREEAKFDVFLNADHFKSVQGCKDALDVGYDTVLFEGIKLPFEQNVSETRDVVAYAKKMGGMPVEGELGYLKGSSQIQDKIEITPDDYTKPEEAAEFFRRTNVERMAIAFGNIHGIVTDQEMNLDIEHLKKVAAAVPDVNLVLHGASGFPDEQVSAAIKAGMTNVHFNTELRVAYSTSLREELKDHPDQTTPYKYMAPAADAVKAIVKHKLELFMR